MASECCCSWRRGRGMGKLIWQRGMNGWTYFISSLPRPSLPPSLPSFLPSFFPRRESRVASRIIHLNFGLSVLILTESGGTRTPTRTAISCVRATCITFRCTPASVGRVGPHPAPPALAYRRQVVANFNSNHVSLFETFTFTFINRWFPSTL